MICTPPSLLERAAKKHGAAYHDDLLNAGQLSGEQFCIEPDDFNRIQQKHGIKPPGLGLGDRLASFLAFFGIHPWPGCGCAGRRQWLNALGRRFGL